MAGSSDGVVTRPKAPREQAMKLTRKIATQIAKLRITATIARGAAVLHPYLARNAGGDSHLAVIFSFHALDGDTLRS